MIEGSAIRPSGTIFNRLPCVGVELPEYVEIGKQIFLISQLPCCANLALPYWAKITGDIINRGSDEKLLSVEAVILDQDNNAICSFEDFIALESGSKGKFEILIFQYDERAKAYALAVKEAQGL